jgi:ketosteroid isomerase-like protein
MKLLNILILTLIVSSAGAVHSTSESEMWINNKTWEVAFNTGNAAALTDLYSEDAVVMPPSLEILNAPDTIENYWVEQMHAGTDNFRVQTINLKVENDIIYQTAVWIATVTSNGVSTDLDGEMTNVITRQEDGSWKIKLQSWN